VSAVKVSQLSPIFSRKPASLPIPTSTPRLAGSTPALSKLFQRAKPGLPFVGPLVSGGVAGYRLQQGEKPVVVATDAIVDEGAAALGAGIGLALGGPLGAAAGGILAPIVANMTMRDEQGRLLRPVDLSGFSASELREIAGAPRTTGLTIPAPYEAPPVSPISFDFSFDQAATTAERETGRDVPERGVVRRPADTRPSPEAHPPVSQRVPPSPTPRASVQAVTEDLLAKAADQERTAELSRRMIELGLTGGMTADNMRQWVSSNSELAERLIADRMGRKERLAKEFAGFSEYSQ